MLHGFNHPYFAHAAALFQVMGASISPPTVLTLSLADEEDENLAIRADIQPMLLRQKYYRALSMKRRLESRCKGLLEITHIRLDAPELSSGTGENVFGRAIGTFGTSQRPDSRSEKRCPNNRRSRVRQHGPVSIPWTRNMRTFLRLRKRNTYIGPSRICLSDQKIGAE